MPLQQAIRHQQAAYAAFFAKRARTRGSSPGRASVRGVHPSGSGGARAPVPGDDRHAAGLHLVLARHRPRHHQPDHVTVSRIRSAARTLPRRRRPRPRAAARHGRALRIDLGSRTSRSPVTSSGSPTRSTWNGGPRTWPATSAARPLSARQRQPRQSQGQGRPGAPQVRAARADFLHKTSTRLVRDHDLICLEDLAVKNMVRNHSVARRSRTAGGCLPDMLEYRRPVRRRVIVIDRWFPSSKMCSACGYVLAELPDVRTWLCPSCGTRHDRDVNAAKNILAAGLAVAGATPGYACGLMSTPRASRCVAL